MRNTTDVSGVSSNVRGSNDRVAISSWFDVFKIFRSLPAASRVIL